MVENRLYKTDNQKMNLSNEAELGKRVRELDDVQMGTRDGKAQAHNALLHLARTIYDRALNDPANAKATKSKFASLHGLKIEDAVQAKRLCHIACGVAMLVLSIADANGMSILRDHEFVLCRTCEGRNVNKEFFLKCFRLTWDVRHGQLLRELAQSRSWMALDSQDVTVAEEDERPARKSDSSFLLLLFRKLKKRDAEAVRFLVEAIPQIQTSPKIGSFDLSRNFKGASTEEVQLARWISSKASDRLLKRLKSIKIDNAKARKSIRK